MPKASPPPAQPLSQVTARGFGDPSSGGGLGRLAERSEKVEGMWRALGDGSQESAFPSSVHSAPPEASPSPRGFKTAHGARGSLDPWPEWHLPSYPLQPAGETL